MAVRKNLYNLTDPEWAKLVTAIKGLKNNGRYDSVYVKGHFDVVHHFTPPPTGGSGGRNSGHAGPAFFVWHREFLRRYERELQVLASDPNLGLPYWDWAADFDQGKDARIFQDKRMGGTGMPVTDGDFTLAKGWAVSQQELGGVMVPVVPARGLNRVLGGGVSTLPKREHVDAALAFDNYDSPSWNIGSAGFRNSGEGFATVLGQEQPNTHNRVHVWVGGDLLPASSPNDPIFFFHHCFVDKMLADWQALHPSSEYLPRPSADASLLGHRWDDPMWPWDGIQTPGDIVRVRDVWDHRALGYTYDNTPASPPAAAGGCFSKLAKLFDP